MVAVAQSSPDFAFARVFNTGGTLAIANGTSILTLAGEDAGNVGVTQVSGGAGYELEYDGRYLITLDVMLSKAVAEVGTITFTIKKTTGFVATTLTYHFDVAAESVNPRTAITAYMNLLSDGDILEIEAINSGAQNVTADIAMQILRLGSQ